MNLAYRLHPEHVPKFGLKSWIEDDARIVTEACGVPGCTDCFKERFMFDDRKHRDSFPNHHPLTLRAV